MNYVLNLLAKGGGQLETTAFGDRVAHPRSDATMRDMGQLNGMSSHVRAIRHGTLCNEANNRCRKLLAIHSWFRSLTYEPVHTGDDQSLKSFGKTKLRTKVHAIQLSVHFSGEKSNEAKSDQTVTSVAAFILRTVAMSGANVRITRKQAIKQTKSKMHHD